MKKAILFTIIEPKAEGESPKLYYVNGNHFSTDKTDAHIFTDRDEMMAVQDKFPFDLQMEYVEEL